MVFADPMPDDAALEEYNANYFDNAHGGASNNKLAVAFHSGINLLRVIHVEAYMKQMKTVVKNVLEIGPGGGYFAKHWLNRNKDIVTYTAVDSDTTFHKELIHTGLAVYTNTKDLPVDQPFDLVVISHVLEHTSHPGDFIRECTRLLSPGGILFIEVPCKDYEHKPVVEPHLLFFDKEPMKLLLSKQGFDRIKLSYHGNTINELKKPLSFFSRLYNKARNFLTGRGILFPFSISERGLTEVDNLLERASVKPYRAHIEQTEPSWWLRATAIKK
jgi:SAM-dependent methyltransferase